MTNNSNIDKERYELILWNIEMLDNRRMSVANRSAIVLSADALLLAATTFLLDKALTNIIQFNLFERVILALSIGSTILLLVLSIGFATTGIANVWRTSRKMLGTRSSDMPQRLFFHPTDTVKSFTSFKSFEDSFRSTNIEQMEAYALGELWTVINQHYSRYQILRITIRFLLFSIVPFIASVFILLAGYF